MPSTPTNDKLAVRFSCVAELSLAPDEVAAQILDLSRWSGFKGYGLLPGVKAATFEDRTPGIVGTRIRVTNTDGSSHVEEIVEWDPNRNLKLSMHEFSAPLSHLATSFDENWEFERNGETTFVVRSFLLRPKSRFTRPAIWLISLLLKRAVARHLSELSRVS